MTKRVLFFSIMITMVAALIAVSLHLLKPVSQSILSKSIRSLSYFNYLSRQQPQPKFTPDPILGFTHRNNTGAMSKKENFVSFYDKIRADNQIKIAFTGGSVGHNFVDWLLEKKMAKKIGEALQIGSDKKIKIIDLTVGAYKQPQLLLSSLLMSHTYDMVVSLEGINELYRQGITSYPNYSPNGQLTKILYLNDPEILQSYISGLKVVAWRDFMLLARKNEWVQLSGLITLTNLFAALSIKYLKNIELSINEMNKEKAVWATEKTVAHRRAPQLWIQNLKIQHFIFNKRNVPLLTIFQPTPYLPNAKIFSDEELKLTPEVNRKEKKFNILVMNTFDHLIKKTDLKIFDARYLFRNVDQTIFTDTCCHMNDTGRKMLFNFIIEKISLHRNEIMEKITSGIKSPLVER